MSKPIVAVIGNGMVGHHFIEQMMECNDYQLRVFCEEPRLAYDRVQLTRYFSDGSVNGLMLADAAEYQKNGVLAHINTRVDSIDRNAQLLHCSDGESYHYDRLVLATGSYPFVPPIPGKEQPHIHPYRTIEDLELIQAAASNSKVGVVIGGGLLGLEAANALKTLGLETHVVEFAPRLMAVQLDEDGAALLQQKINDLGVQVHTGKATQQIEAYDGDCRYRLQFADGSELLTDMVVFSAGIRPQDTLAKQATLEMGERGGIVINDQCQTSDPNIFAIGECALWQERLFGLVAPGYQMAKVAAAQLTGQQLSFTGADMSTKLKLLGVDVASIGDAHGTSAGSLSYCFHDHANQVYKKVVIDPSGTKLIGAVLVGDNSDYHHFLQLCLNEMPLPQPPETILLPAIEGDATAAAGVDALPDSAQICSCHDVSKGDITTAVDSLIAEGGCDLSSLKACTKAGTGCGGCTQLVGQLLDKQLAAKGMEVNNDLCAHFPYSRTELFDVIRIRQIKTFEELLTRCGQGGGCEICRPAVGSMLASLWNDYILEDSHASLQDTNDRYLGNMQKNGTYSVVPRIPGGEITPDKLIVIGQVAKEFNLYTKITGGQRIDLFGAQLHQLPLIWAQLVAAGFETGHAYGKAMRTVKSCVGTNWCRYGVQDSTSMAIAIEHRYRGVRSPHKIKLAVSGCARECAEAQSKDFGVIATEAGWNLYVGGNGGMRPRHADLFATDLDDDTLIAYIDRIMMFYVRTAERLQRTSVWIENLEGGLDYLKQVVIEDKLDLCEQLEQQMAYLVDTYQCEWATTLQNPDKLSKFTHFINSDQTDNAVVFEQQRGQIQPASSTIDIMEIS
ncbi:nitrite reductase large subunit NirB [Ferrimonas lipolytica]|uniref:Nitrite reductase large subunit n=1 Tax=Ferrimonas lipolytica TaxID=2724191 RepID=A0A6H1UHB0_9GAMM|nr:nitrite reductase large subunit NirB [Ferrimonas lipolytica]QIZ77703.1 nitrite reductase large subunit [Ferrimonas lipolytica]